MKFLATIIFFAAMMIGGCSEPPTCTRSEILMGTVVTLKATGSDAQVAVEFQS